MTARRAAVVLAVALLPLVEAGRAVAQTAEEVVARNLAARGLDRWRAVQTMRLTGAATAGGRTVPVVVLRKRPNLMRQETAFPAGTVVAVFDGRRAWTINPYLGSRTPREVSGPLLELAREQADFDGLLVDYAAKGHRIELAGTETLDGRAAHRVILTKRDGLKHDFLIDAETALEIKTVAFVSRAGRLAVSETELGDYRQVGGVTIPFRVRDFVDGSLVSELVVQQVELDVKVDDRSFRKD
jgi:outer membrane lipoprotein-sorting protein